METNQIYELVNDVAQQTMGSTAIKAVDASTLVTLGSQVMTSGTNVENFLNTLVQRIGRTIISYRKYTNNFAGIVMDDFQWGAIIQKIKVQMPKMVEDESYELTDGDSIDMYTIAKPKAKQKFFYKRTPYMCYVTIQEFQLKEAFLSAGAMGSFLSAVYGEVQNYLDLALENLGRVTVANFIAQIAGTSQEIKLVSMYNEIKGTTLTATKAMYDEDFLRFAVGRMNTYKRYLTGMTTIYNAEGETRHTPAAYQKLALLTDFRTACETQVQWAAFHEDYVKNPNADIYVNYWQALQTPDEINLTVQDGDDTNTATKDVTLSNIVGFIFDRDALGTFRKEEAVLTTPMNAKGRYTNTFWHENQMWFNDLSENALVFTLN